jgi:ABC-type nitrate/sulfonate/bicarbonate transport system permease component
MIPRWLAGVRGRVPAQISIVLGLVPMAAILALWWFSTRGPAEERAISPTLLPSPAEVARSFPDLVRRDLFHHALVSFERIGVGYVCALALVLPLGILMGAFGVARSIFSPTATASGYIPIATLVPLTLSWFGTGELQKVVFLAMAFGIYLLPLVVKAIESVPDVYLKTSLTLGASSWQIIMRVLVPIALPDIWHSMRLAFGVGWTYLVLTEVVVMESGLGYLVQMSFRRGPREHIYLVILVITAIAWGADLAWRKAGAFLFRYREGAA